MTARLKGKRLAALELARERDERERARRHKQRQGEAARALAGFARALVLEASWQGRPSTLNAAPTPRPLRPPGPTAEERKEAELDRLRGLLQGYQLTSAEALKLIGKHPELATVKGWKEPPPHQHPPAWMRSVPPTWAPNPLPAPPKKEES